MSCLSFFSNIFKRKKIIGNIEPIYFLPVKEAFLARIDTGAQISSIGVSELKKFKKDGQKWVSFKVTNPTSNETIVFEKQIAGYIKIVRPQKSENRIKVVMDIRLGNKIFQKEFTLANRQNFKYQVLVGRNILTNFYIVDTSLSNTLS